MESLTWSERFFTGLELVDEQHHRLVDLINEFGELCSRHAEVPRAHLEAVVDALASYAATHFHDEEALMRQAGLDARFLTMHYRQHGLFLRDVGNMRAAHFLEQPETARVLLRFLLHWLAFHILGTDMQAARQIERVQRGEAAAAAFAAEVREVEGPTQLLLGALDDLMSVIARRNTELSEANRGLEERVAQRTAELQAANGQLTQTLETLRTTQAKLVETAKLASVGLLASGVAHEVNNPLAFVNANVVSLEEHGQALSSFVETVAAEEPKMPASVRAVLAHAREELDVDYVKVDLIALIRETRNGVRRVMDIVRNLKDFSRVEGGSFAELDLAQCVETTQKIVPAALCGGITFVTQFQPATRVRCDGAQVNQAIHALLLNAALAVRDRADHQGSITLRTGVEGRGAFFEVEDTGVGMQPEVLGRAFEPFFTTRPPGQGVGLGLTTAYNCATSHGGRLEGRSVPGAGSVFRLWLPFESPQGAPAAPQQLTNDFNTRRYARATPSTSP